MADEAVERVSLNPGGLDEHRPLHTGDLPLIAEYVKNANKSSSRSDSSTSKRKPARKPAPKSRAKSGGSK